MTYTFTQTQTYTVADVKNVFEQVAADLAMISRTTTCWLPDYRENVIADVLAYAEARYLQRVDIVHRSSAGVTLRASRYDVNDSAASWENARAQGNFWPRVEGATLTVVLTWSKAWGDLSELQRSNFRKTLRLVWGVHTVDLAYPGLQAAEPVRYASRGYGVERRTYGSQ